MDIDQKFDTGNICFKIQSYRQKQRNITKSLTDFVVLWKYSNESLNFVS